MYTREDVLEKARESNVKFIRLQFTDIFGMLKNIAVTVEDLPRILAGEMIFDSSVVEGQVRNRERDIVLLPEPSTFVVFPWRPREGAVARLICDVANPDGTPYPGCSRNVLKKVLERAARRGFTARVGTEAEFYLFHTDEKGNPTTDTHDRAGFCDLTPVDQGENARRDMVLTLEEMDFEIGSSHHELGHGQHEIVLKQEHALGMADKVVTFKFVVRTIAQRHGLYASFMPKPINGMPGSALHWHISLDRLGGGNALFAAAQPMGLSDEARFFIGGMLAHIQAITALTNPTVNSYKRLVPGDLSPTYVAWSEHNRNTVIRVPAHRGEQTRVEVRNPDPACNPYLALASMIEAGMDGIARGAPPPPPVAENLFQMDNSQREALQVGCLPRHLQEALDELEADQLIRETLGEYIYQRFAKAKRQEWERYQNNVHPWELREYLGIF